MAKTQTPDISNLTLNQLQTLVAAAQERIVEVEEEERKQALDKVQAAADAVGMSPAELLKHFAVGARARKPVKPKYHNPDNPSETWTGRGRKPEWVKTALEAGKTLAEMEIKD